MIAGGIGTLDIAELALKTEIDNFSHILGLEFLAIDLRIFLFRTIAVDGIEHLGETAAKFDAQAAVGAEAENALHLGAQIPFVKVSFVRRIIGGIVAHESLLQEL